MDRIEVMCTGVGGQSVVDESASESLQRLLAPPCPKQKWVSYRICLATCTLSHLGSDRRRSRNPHQQPSCTPAVACRTRYPSSCVTTISGPAYVERPRDIWGPKDGLFARGGAKQTSGGRGMYCSPTRHNGFSTSLHLREDDKHACGCGLID
jgi:hypothetical protein